MPATAPSDVGALNDLWYGRHSVKPRYTPTAPVPVLFAKSDHCRNFAEAVNPRFEERFSGGDGSESGQGFALLVDAEALLGPRMLLAALLAGDAHFRLVLCHPIARLV